MYTFEGRKVAALHGGTVVTTRDIAQALAREGRWGWTVAPWSVLQHSIAAYQVAVARGLPLATQFAALMHDSEEALTGDVRRPFKTPEQSAMAESARAWLYEATFRLPYPNEVVADAVKSIDDALATAEAHCVLHPRARADYPELDMDVVDTVWSLLDMDEREAVAVFCSLAESMLATPSLKAMSARA